MTEPAHPLSMHPETKRWGNGVFRTLPPRDQRPHGACPSCYGDAVSNDPGTIIEQRCARGHTWTQTRTEGEAHATWLARFSTGLDRNI